MDYTQPIAKSGEQQYACIKRNRSGIDSGSIDYALRSLSDLSDPDKQEICDTALLLYENICRHTKHKAKDYLVDSILK